MATATIETWFGTGQVTIDPWAVNGLADDLKAANPWAWSLAITEGPPPKMFADGTADLPAFTASGIDPALLLKVPAACRHALAAEPDRGRVLEGFEQCQADPNAGLAHPGLDAAVRRLRDWAAGRGQRVDVINLQLDEQDEQRRRQADIDAAFVRGGSAASDALIRSYVEQDKQLQIDEARRYGEAMAAAGMRRADGGGWMVGP